MDGIVTGWFTCRPFWWLYLPVYLARPTNVSFLPLLLSLYSPCRYSTGSRGECIPPSCTTMWMNTSILWEVSVTEEHGMASGASQHCSCWWCMRMSSKGMLHCVMHDAAYHASVYVTWMRFVLADLQPQTFYEFRILASNDAGNSSYTNPVNFTTYSRKSQNSHCK